MSVVVLKVSTCRVLSRVHTWYMYSPDPLVSLVAVYMSLPRHDGHMYPLVSGYKLLVRGTCIWCKRGFTRYTF